MGCFTSSAHGKKYIFAIIFASFFSMNFKSNQVISIATFLIVHRVTSCSNFCFAFF
jgi:hypothetical protein